MLTKLRYDLKLSPDAPRPFIIRTHTSWPAHPFPRRDGVPAIFASTQFQCLKLFFYEHLLKR